MTGKDFKADRKVKKARCETPPKKDTSSRLKSVTPSDTKGKEKAKAVHSVSSPQSTPPTSFKIVAGSYEKLLYGLEGTASSSESKYEFHLKPVFIFPAHVSHIKAVAASPGGKWLATGSADEIIKVWDLARRKEIGGLMHHEGSITYLEFPSRSHLLSASEDGTMSLFHARDWVVLRTFKGHKGRVNSVAVHPSGKIALSVGQDRTLRMWDLMRGKGSSSIKLGKEGEIVRWSLRGSFFIVQYHSSLEIFSTDMVLRHTLSHASRIHCVRFCRWPDDRGELMLVAAEDKKVSVYQFFDDPEKSPSIIAEMVGHSNRVKAVETLEVAMPGPETKSQNARKSTTIACTISSDGNIFVYDLAALHDGTTELMQLRPVAEYDTKGTRLTCLTVSENRSKEETDDGHAKIGKRKRADEREDSGEEEGKGAEKEGEEGE
ncbi:WD40-repeat-containing domain protein [Pisolithus marmoratus]|nr:WD40-repeat-containing domain protein [Pisolithus marmoratus]